MFMSATQNADERGCCCLTGEENTGHGIFLGVVFTLRPTFFFICIKIDPPDDQKQDFFPGLSYCGPARSVHEAAGCSLS